MIVAQLGPNLKFKKGRPHQVLFRFSVISGSPAEVTGTSAPGVEADVIGGKADIPVLLPSSSTKGKTFSAKGPKFSARMWKNISVRMPDSTATCDRNGDGLWGIVDYLSLFGAWGSCSDCGTCPADFYGDCSVGVLDLLILLGNWTL